MAVVLICALCRRPRRTTSVPALPVFVDLLTTDLVLTVRYRCYYTACCRALSVRRFVELHKTDM